jgi:AcrR family transcriptional regulator
MQPSSWMGTLSAVVHDSQATKRRLLDAAFVEFVDVGLAGARVDRIARAASANKQAIYAYFGSKELLFDAVLTERLQYFADLVPLTPEDLPAYAGALFDLAQTHPENLRLRAWQQLERPEITGEQADSFASKVAALEEAYSFDAGRGGAATMYMLLLALVTSSTTLSGIATTDAAAVAQHRAALVAGVGALVEALATKRSSDATR